MLKQTQHITYRIYPAIRNFAIILILPFLNNLKDLDPSCKTDLDLWDCFGRKKNPSYNRRNTVHANAVHLISIIFHGNIQIICRNVPVKNLVM